MTIAFNLSSIQTDCLSAFLASFGNVFKICRFDLALVSAMGNICLLNEDYNYKNEQKWWS